MVSVEGKYAMKKDRVLIVDDEDSSQKLLVSLLESYTDICIEKRVYSGRQALECLSKDQYVKIFRMF